MTRCHICHSKWHTRGATIFALGWIGLALSLGGCDGGSVSGVRADDAATARDAGSRPDSGPTVDAGVAISDAGEPTVPPAESDMTGLAACLDAEDNDEDDSFDCDDPDCASAVVCCIGEATTACCGEPTLGWALDFRGCEGGDIERCFGDGEVLAFGDPPPQVQSGRLLGSGDALYESGLVLTEVLDPRRAILRLSATLSAPARCESPGCLDAITVGLVEPRSFGSSPTIHPIVALRVNGVLREVSLLVQGEKLGGWPLSDEGAHTYHLTVHPDGSLELEQRDEGAASVPLMASAGTPRFQPPDQAVAVVFGRTDGVPDGPSAVGLSRLEVHRAGCDVPQAESRATAALLPATGASWASSASTLGAFSIAERPALEGEDGPERRAVFELGGLFYEVGVDPATGDLVREVNLRAPVLSGNVEFAQAGIHDPELVADRARERWVLYFTAVDNAGRRSIGRAIGEERYGFLFATPIEQVMAPDSRYSGYSEPASVPLAFGERMLLAKAEGQGTTRIVILREDLGGPSFRLDDRSFDGGALLYASHGSPYAFDRDEVGAPSVVEIGGVLRIFYAGRRGTRWGIGMLVSPDLRAARDPLHGEPLLLGSGDGFDALGVAHPAALRTSEGLALYYAGTDGVRWRIGRAEIGGVE